MKVALVCDSPLLKKSLEIYLKESISGFSRHEAGTLWQDRFEEKEAGPCGVGCSLHHCGQDNIPYSHSGEDTYGNIRHFHIFSSKG